MVTVDDRAEQRFSVRLHVLDDLNTRYRADVSMERAASFE